MTPSQWTRIDPAVHTPEWFDGRGVVFLLRYNDAGIWWETECRNALGKGTCRNVPRDATHFLLHPPLPDPLEEEIEREAEERVENLRFTHSVQYPEVLVRGMVKTAFIAGARAFLGRKA